MLFDYLNGGDLFSHLQKKTRFSRKNAKLCYAQLYLALKYLHSMNVLYQDLKTDNIISDKDGNIKHIDFGLSKNNFSSENLGKTIGGTR